MNSRTLYQLIQHPATIAQDDVKLLSELSERFPWCQPVQMLLSKGLHNTKSIAYLDHLKRTSAITSDRSVLYHFIIQQGILEKLEKLDKVIEEELRIEENNAPELPIAEEQTELQQYPDKKSATIIPISSNPYAELEGVDKDQAMVLVTKDILEDLIERKIKDFVPSDASTEILPKKANEEQTTKEIIEVVTSPDVLDPDSAVEIKEKSIVDEPVAEKFSELEKEFLWQAVNASIQIDVMGDLEKMPELDVKNPIPETDFPRKEKPRSADSFNWEKPHSFLNWLVPKAEEPAPEREPDHFRPAKSDQPVEDLVDQFLKKDPKITPQKAEFYTPGNVAKLSIADNEDFVSETLAGIYEKQGYYAKAIRVYEKLSLKNPGKSSFFASRIKELEALKNSKNK
ncbi:MAG: hypothetical protein ACK40M_11325 [Flavobacteriales bacterium]